jgi:addiction module HigA family antidote
MASRSCVAIHPGKILRREMDATGLNSLKLADALHVPVNRVIEILSCDRDITADMALRLARLFGSSAQEWLQLQNGYSLACANCEAIEREIVPLARALNPKSLGARRI